MLLVIDVGNTQTAIGVYEGESLDRMWRVATNRDHTADELRALMEQILEEEAAFTVKHLAINGRDIMALGVAASPEVGRLLDACLDAVIDERVPNEREELLAFAEELRKEAS